MHTYACIHTYTHKHTGSVVIRLPLRNNILSNSLNKETFPNGILNVGDPRMCRDPHISDNGGCSDSRTEGIAQRNSILGLQKRGKNMNTQSDQLQQVPLHQTVPATGTRRWYSDTITHGVPLWQRENDDPVGGHSLVRGKYPCATEKGPFLLWLWYYVRLCKGWRKGGSLKSRSPPHTHKDRNGLSKDNMSFCLLCSYLAYSPPMHPIMSTLFFITCHCFVLNSI